MTSTRGVKASLGLDVGTTSIKAVVLGEDGALLGQAASGPITTSAPHKGWATQTTKDLHTELIDCLRSIVTALPGNVEIDSMSIAAQSGSIVLVDRSGKIEKDLRTWMDTRSSMFVNHWNKNGTAQLIRKISGWEVHAGQGLPQLAWTNSTDPERWEATGRIASADDLIGHWLTGSWVTNPSNAAAMVLMDISTGQWSQRLCDLVDVNTHQLSELRASGTKIACLNERTANTTGLSQDITLFNGGHDQTCTALALGVTKAGQALLACGTAWVLTSVITPEEVASIPPQMNVSFHVEPQLRTASKYFGGLGSSLEWWLAKAYSNQGHKDRFAKLDEDLRLVTTSASSPYFIPEATREHPGAGVFHDGTATTTDGDRARSIMEYAAFKLKTALLDIPESHRPTSLTVVGGATRAPGWTQLIADVCEITVFEAGDRAWPAIGAAILAGAASGLYPSIEDGVAAVNFPAKAITPTNTELYRPRYEIHLSQETQT